MCYENFFIPEIILSCVENSFLLQNPTRSSSGISTDSRTIQSGDIFVALRGPLYDGHSFLLELSEQKKVSALVVEESTFFALGFEKEHFPADVGIYVVADTLIFYGKLAKKYFNLFSGTRIVITGSSGKTTVREYLAQMLSLRYKVFQSKKNYNNKVGIPQSIFAIQQSYDYFILEAGISQRGEMDWLGEILSPNIVVITGVFPAHLEGLDTIEGILQEKISLVKFLQPFGCCYVPHWDQNLACRNLPLPPHTNKMLISQMVQTHSVWSKNHGWITKVTYQETQQTTCLSIAAPFQSKNLSISYAIAREHGVSHEVIFDNLEKLISQPGRFQVLCKDPYLIYDAYNANPYSMVESVRWILESALTIPKFFLLGDVLEMGTWGPEIHKKIGTQVDELIQNQSDIMVFFVGPAMRVAFDHCLSDKKQYFFSTKEVIGFLQNKIHKEALYYLKASRGMRFETICYEAFSCSIT